MAPDRDTGGERCGCGRLLVGSGKDMTVSEMPELGAPDRRAGFDEAAIAARAGDLEAAASLLLAELPYLLGAARRIAPRASDTEHEDLVQASLVRLFEAWSDGRGPEQNVRAYLTVSMRNAHIDEQRSPRSRVEAIDDTLKTDDERLAMPPDDGFRVAELHRESALLREALQRLPEDQRRLLWRTVVEGCRPAELTGEFGRSAAAISSALLRAKQTLHRSVLVVLLSRGGEECARNAERLPRRVGADPGEHSVRDRGIVHVRGCDECQRRWRFFAGLSSALGVLPLLAVVARALPAGFAGTSAAPRPASIGAGAAVPRSVRLLGSPAWRATAVALLVLAAGAGALAIQPELGGGSRDVADPNLQLVVTAVRSGSDVELEVDFDRPGDSWRMGELRIRLPEGSTVVRAAEGWTCSGGGSVRCEPLVAWPGQGEFGVMLGSRGPYEMTFGVESVAGEPRVMRTRAWGDF